MHRAAVNERLIQRAVEHLRTESKLILRMVTATKWMVCVASTYQFTEGMVLLMTETVLSDCSELNFACLGCPGT